MNDWTTALPAAGLAPPYRLRAEHLDRAWGLPTAEPRLSWVTPPVPGDWSAAGWHVQAARGASELIAGHPDLWDSGWRHVGKSHLTAYGGEPLRSRDAVAWRVRVRYDHGGVGPWSEPATFTVGLLDPEDWTAQWIGPSTHESNGACVWIETAFDLPDHVESATLYATALGLYDAQLNGRPATLGRLNPGWTDYTKRIAVQSFDVAGHVQRGANRLSFTLAEGWYGGQLGWTRRGHVFNFGPPPPRLLAQLECVLTGGERFTLGSGAAWRWAGSGVTAASLYFGATEDRRRTRALEAGEAPGEAFRGVAVFDPPPGRLVPQSDPLIVTAETLPARSVTPIDRGVRIDFGQNLAGVCRLDLDEPEGREITLRHGELLEPDGSLHTANLRMAESVDRFTAAGGRDTLEPRFTYHGFRYAEVTGTCEPLPPERASAVVIRSDCPPTLRVSTSSPLVDRIVEMCGWTLRSNLVGVLTDCPQRDERFGWFGDASAFAGSACYLHDLAPLLGKLCDDAIDCQRPDGVYPDFAPWVPGIVDDHGGPGYMDGPAVYAHLAWRRYGDLAPARRLLPGLLAYLRYVRRHNPDGLWKHRRGHDYGDWVGPRPRADKTQIATLMLLRTTRCVAELAEAAGEKDVAHEAGKYANELHAAFSKACLTPEGYHPVSQATAAVALGMGLVPDGLVGPVSRQLVRAIDERGGLMHTGMMSTPYLLPALTRTGRHDVAVRLLLERRRPSWGYEIEQGATTVWERWDADQQDDSMNSRNHFAFGSVLQWIVTDLAGIRPASPGFESVAFRPTWLSERHAELDRVDVAYDSPRGPLRLAWRDLGDRIEVEAAAPPTVHARFHVPDGFAVIDEEPGPGNGGTLVVTGSRRVTLERRPGRRGAGVEPASGQPQRGTP